MSVCASSILRLGLDNGWALAYADQRKFGRVLRLTDEEWEPNRSAHRSRTACRTHSRTDLLFASDSKSHDADQGVPARSAPNCRHRKHLRRRSPLSIASIHPASAVRFTRPNRRFRLRDGDPTQCFRRDSTGEGTTLLGLPGRKRRRWNQRLPICACMGAAELASAKNVDPRSCDWWSRRRGTHICPTCQPAPAPSYRL